MATDSPRSAATRTALMEAALEVGAEFGLRGVTHRRVAKHAGVSLGVTSYHFANIDELLLDAFAMWVARASARWEKRFLSATDEDAMVEASIGVIEAIHDHEIDSILLYELYAQSVRDERYRALVSEWSRSTRAAVEQLYSAETAQRAEAAWEGISVQLIMGAIPTARAGAPLLRLVLAQESLD